MTLEESGVSAWMRGRGWCRIPHHVAAGLASWVVQSKMRPGMWRLDRDPWEGMDRTQRQTAAKAGGEIVNAWREGRAPDGEVMGGDLGRVILFDLGA